MGTNESLNRMLEIRNKADQMNNKSLQTASKILSKKNKFMHKYMNYYLFKKINVESSKSFSNIKNYKAIIEFCLKTRRFPNDISVALKYFGKNYNEFVRLIKNKDVARLRELVIKPVGVGQKIGSFILEVFIHYGLKDHELSKKLFVPIDSHVARVLRDAFHVDISKSNLKYDSKRFLEIQNLLKENAAGQNVIYFDYLWLVGKVFHQKIDSKENSFSRGHLLCNICWIKSVCKYEGKWILD